MSDRPPHDPAPTYARHRRAIVIGAIALISIIIAATFVSRQQLPASPNSQTTSKSSSETPNAITFTSPPNVTDSSVSNTPMPAGLTTTDSTENTTVGRAKRGSTVIRLAPSESSEVIATLFFDTPLPILGRQPEEGTVQWYKTKLWGAVEGWVKANQVDLETTIEAVRPFWEGQTPTVPSYKKSEPFPLSAIGHTNNEVNMRAEIDTGSGLVATIEANTALQIDGWATDEEGNPWYHTTNGSASGWIHCAYVELQTQNRDKHEGQPLWTAISGRGMWIPANFVELVNPRYLVSAAKALGLSHLYVEVAESEAGFFGSTTLDSLLPVAHDNGLNVIAWITPNLLNVPSDTSMTSQVSSYRTPDGHQIDGIAVDLEQNLVQDNVKAYAQATRAVTGPDRLLIATIMPAKSWAGKTYPVHKVVASVFDAITIMAYWNEEERTYGYQEVYDYAHDAITQMREELEDLDYPVAIIGQMYDTFGRNGFGEHSPTADEIQSAMQAAKDSKAIGISFFQWGTATPEEWAALASFSW